MLDQLTAVGPDLVVPGHDEVTGASLIHDVRDYLDHVRTAAARLRVAGSSAEDAAARIDKDARARWNTWERPEWISFAALVPATTRRHGLAPD